MKRTILLTAWAALASCSSIPGLVAERAVELAADTDISRGPICQNVRASCPVPYRTYTEWFTSTGELRCSCSENFRR